MDIESETKSRKESNNSDPISEAPTEQLAWQHRLLPVMVAMIVVLTVFFFVASLFQLYFIHNRVQDCPQLKMAPALKLLDEIKGGDEDHNRLEAIRWKTLAMLETHALQQRYHQANVLLMARIWVRYLGFVTGMILALVGAVFILGKLREPQSTLAAESGGFKGNISTTSPGLILAFLGTVLMVVTITTHHNIEVKDGPLYTSIPYLISAGQPISKPEDVMNLKAGSPSTPQDHKKGNTRPSDNSAPNVDDLTNTILKRLNNNQ